MTQVLTKSATEQNKINLFDLGTLVNLKVGTWSGKKALTRQDIYDVGLDPDTLPEDLVNLGSKFLVPKTELKTINQLEQKARKFLDKWSVQFGLSSAHFVPVKMLPTVEQELSGIREKFFEVVDSFVARFSDMKETVRKQHPEFWEKCLKKCYPSTPSLLRSRFKFDWFMFQVSGANCIEGTTIEEAMAKNKIKEERIKELKSQMQNEVKDFVGEYVASMRAETIKFCELMTARVNGQPYGDEDEAKQLTGRSLAMFKKYIDRFRNMNIFGDTEIEKMLEEFNKNFLMGEVSPADFDNEKVKESLTTSLAAIKQRALIEGKDGTEFIGQLKRRIVI